VSNSTLIALENLTKNPYLKRGTSKWVDKIYDLMDQVDIYILIPKRRIDKPFLMVVEDVFPTKGHGTMVTGHIERGIIRVGEIVKIVGLRGNHSTIVTSLEMFQKTFEENITRNNVGILLEDVQRKNIQRGMIIAKPGNVKSHIRFEAQVYNLQKENGKCHSLFFWDIIPNFIFVRLL